MAVVLLVHGDIAAAASCGDDIGGVRVPCDCGDRVVADTVLQVGDPVVSRRCPLDGLVLRAPALADSITLNLNGLALVGESFGYGVRVETGGSDGARIVSNGVPAEIVGFGIGVLVRDAHALARVDNVIVKGNTEEGLNLHSAGVLVTNVTAIDNGGDGIRMTGTGGRLIGVQAIGNRKNGIRTSSRGVSIDALASFNTLDGIVVGGTRNDVSKARAENNGRNGVVLRGGPQEAAGAVSLGNARSAIQRRGKDGAVQ